GARRPALAPGARWFGRKGGDPEAPTRLEDTVAFAATDGDGVAEIGGVRIERPPGARRVRVLDRGAVLADVGEDEMAPTPAAPARPPKPFAPPAFGLTVLGASHGFDPAGKTTGFVLWTNRRGVLVHPPTDATDVL